MVRAPCGGARAGAAPRRRARAQASAGRAGEQRSVGAGPGYGPTQQPKPGDAVRAASLAEKHAALGAQKRAPATTVRPSAGKARREQQTTPRAQVLAVAFDDQRGAPLPDFEERGTAVVYDAPVPRQVRQKAVVIDWHENNDDDFDSSGKVFIHHEPSTDGAAWGGYALIPSIDEDENYGLHRQLTIPASPNEMFVFTLHKQASPAKDGTATSAAAVHHVTYEIDPQSIEGDVVYVHCTPDGCEW